MEAKAFADQVDKFNIKKADFLVVNNDWGRGAAERFGDMLKEHDITVGEVETMDPAAQDMSAQLSKIKASDADTLFVTTGVEQLTLVLKQARALGLDEQIITTGGSQAPDQLIEQAGGAANGSYHLLFFTPWFPDAAQNPEVAEKFVAEWERRGYNFAGLTEGFRGYDGIMTIAAAIEAAGKAEPEAIREALWTVDVHGVNGDIKFTKQGPEGSESGQNVPNVYVVGIEDGKVVQPQL
jgi:branched-chain amino acid transport system substrate-binding protein